MTKHERKFVIESVEGEVVYGHWVERGATLSIKRCQATLAVPHPTQYGTGYDIELVRCIRPSDHGIESKDHYGTDRIGSHFGWTKFVEVLNTKRKEDESK